MLLNQYFPPDGGASAHLLGQLAEDLARKHEVTVITGRPSYTATESNSCPAGMKVVRVPSTSFSHRTLAGRACNYLSFAVLSCGCACLLPRPDVVVTMTNPPIIGLVGLLARARHRSRFVQICHDVYPDLAIALGWLSNGVIERVWRRANAVVRSRSAQMMVVGRDMAERLRGQGVDEGKLVYVPAWADPQVRDAAALRAVRAQQDWEGRFVVMHAGNVGLAQNVGIWVDLAERLRDEPETLIVVLGDGVAKPTLEKMVKERGLANISLLRALPRAEAQAMMAAADLHVISLVAGLWGCAVPSKTYGIMAAGRPFVAAVDPGSEPARLAEEFGCGRWVPAGDADALATAVRDLKSAPLEAMGERGRQAAECEFRRERLTERAAWVLEGVAGENLSSRGPRNSI